MLQGSQSRASREEITMPQATYNFTISTDTANGKVALTALEKEIRASSIVYALAGSSAVGNTLSITFKDVLGSSDQTTLGAVVGAHQGIPLPDPMTSDGYPILIAEPRSDTSTPTILTPNWCDPTTWYYTSARVTNEVLTDSGDHLTYTSANENWIDLRDGALTQGHTLWSTYAPVVTVNDVPQAANSLSGNGGVFSFNAAEGSVTFDEALAPGDVVKATYSKKVDSTWAIVPAAGKKIVLRAVEVQFSMDIDLTTAAVFAPYGPIDIFAPQLLQSNGGPYPSGTKIPLQTSRYDRMHNFIDEAQHAYPNIPKMGGSSWRGMQHEMHIFRWPYTDSYGGPVVLKSSLGMELRIYLDEHIPFLGERAVATLYARSEPE
jgi:hypothetical protein